MILGMTLVTYIPRFLPVAVLSRLEIPEIVVAWLRYIPAAILASLLFPGILVKEKELFINLQNTYLMAALPTFIVAVYKRNIFLTVIAGMAAVILIEFLG